MLVAVSRIECEHEDIDGKNENINMLEMKEYVPDMHTFRLAIWLQICEYGKFFLAT